ncbi:MAG: TRAP transporter small permease subunit [Devosia sp.]|nr:TRAP transporter small permease subunit [Devosia sp.]
MIDRLLAGWKHLSEGVAASAFMLMFAAFIIQIVSRYVLNTPVAWSLELCSIAYVWVVFWSCNTLVPERHHIVFDVLFNAFPPRPRRWLAIVNTLALGLVFLAAIPGVFDYIWFIRRRDTMLLHIRMDLVYSCFAVFMIAVVVGAAIRLRRLAGAGWQQHL